MPLIVENLKSEMLNATENGKSKDGILPALGLAIGNYIKDNAIFLFSWVASNPSSGAADPVAVASGEFKTLTVNFTSFMQSKANSAESAFVLLSADLITSFSTATFNISDAGFTTSPGVFSSSPAIGTLVLQPSSKENREDAFLDLATKIIDWVKSQVPLSPCAGSHSAFVGTGIVTSIM